MADGLGMNKKVYIFSKNPFTNVKGFGIMSIQRLREQPKAHQRVWLIDGREKSALKGGIAINIANNIAIAIHMAEGVKRF